MAAALLVCTAALLATSMPARGQSLVEQYRRARFKAQAERFITESGLYVTPRPAETLVLEGDTLRDWLASFLPAPPPPPPPPPPFVAEDVQLVPRLARGWFARTYGDVQWAFLGRHGFTATDTTRTTVLRARLQHAWGDPTVTVVEQRDDDAHGLHPDDPVEFAYWIVVNDSIPAIVMDDDGPFERGLVFATDQRYRDRLLDIRQALLEEIARREPLAPYVDYYYRALQDRWYRAGYDGERFFVEPIRRPRLLRRPRL